MTEDCVFCDIVGGNFGTQFVYEADDIVAFNDLRPIAPVHILVVPRQHYASLDDAAAAADGGALLGRLMRVAASLGETHASSDGGYRVVVNTGPSAGQTVFHVHLHVLSGRHFAWPPG